MQCQQSRASSREAGLCRWRCTHVSELHCACCSDNGGCAASGLSRLLASLGGSGLQVAADDAPAVAEAHGQSHAPAFRSICMSLWWLTDDMPGTTCLLNAPLPAASSRALHAVSEGDSCCWLAHHSSASWVLSTAVPLQASCSVLCSLAALPQ